MNGCPAKRLHRVTGRSIPVTAAAVAFFLGVVALAAGFLPAWRASRVDPVVALRQP